MTEGRLRYVFGLIKRLLNELLAGDLVDWLSLDIAKSAVINLAKERLKKNGFSTAERELLSVLVKQGPTTATRLAKKN